MPREATGQVVTNADGSRSTRVRVGPGKRPRFRLLHVRGDAATTTGSTFRYLAKIAGHCAGFFCAHSTASRID